MTKYNILFAFLTILMISCERETCFSCRNYDFQTYNQDLDNFKTSFKMCEFDNIWDDITWYNNDYNIGGGFTIVDLDAFMIGWRAIENPDIDGDGITNDNDNDIDGDGIINSQDMVGNTIDNNTIQELIICAEGWRSF